MTKEEILALSHNTILHHKTLKNADGTPKRCRVNGKCQVWKTRPNDFRLPVKIGLYGFDNITQNNASEWSTEP